MTVRTLRNAVSTGSVHHAYLFVGSRGTGKTSMAKILAAALNCKSGDGTDPCGQCDVCTSIAQASSMDVVEMDAASNNSVDDMRQLRDSVSLAPAAGNYKVYILDEAHMLTTQAWNAFLKTLEEPPPNTVFVLATTEPQKVLPTVVDRCHRFDLQRPSVKHVTEVVNRVAAAEGIEISSEAATLIGRASNGSFRDALGTLEQLSTYSEGAIETNDVVAVVGMTEFEQLFAISSALISANAEAALEVVASLVSEGRDLNRFIDDFEEHLRSLLVVSTLGRVPEDLSLNEEQDRKLQECATRLGAQTVLQSIDALTACKAAVKGGSDSRLQLEVALLRSLSNSDLAGGELSTGETQTVSAQSSSQVVDVAEVEEVEEVAQPSLASEQTTSQAPPQPQEPLSIEGLRGSWESIVALVKEDKPMLAHVLNDLKIVEVSEDQELVLAFNPSAAFLRQQAEERESRQALTSAVEKQTGYRLTPVFTISEQGEDESTTALSEDQLITRFKEGLEAEELAGSDQT